MDYMTLFSAANRDKPRFAALARAVLRQAEDLIALVGSLDSMKEYLLRTKNPILFPEEKKEDSAG